MSPLLLLALLAGCCCIPAPGTSSTGAPEPPVQAYDLTVICDATGKHVPTTVCSAGLLQEAFYSFDQRAAYRGPGATFTVINTAGSYETTDPGEPILMPPRWSGRTGRPAWEREHLRALGTHPVPQDDPAVVGTQPNQSDILAAISVAMREAKLRQALAELLIASDGWFISAGFNLDDSEVVPTLAHVREAIAAKGMPWDPSVFQTIVLCGLGTSGQSAAKVAARDELLTQLLTAEGRPAARLHSSCQGLYPPVPTALLRAPVGADSTPSSVR